MWRPETKIHAKHRLSAPQPYLEVALENYWAKVSEGKKKASPLPYCSRQLQTLNLPSTLAIGPNVLCECEKWRKFGSEWMTVKFVCSDLFERLERKVLCIDECNCDLDDFTCKCNK